MRTTQRLYEAAHPIWEQCHDHPFVRGIGDGSLDLEKFRWFLLQDYLYLFDYARVFAYGVVKARDPGLMRTFSALDFLTRISMQEWLLDQWQRHKRTILFITHDVEEALFLSSSVLVVERTPIRELAEIPVPASFPRDRSCLKLPEMVELKEHLIDLLRKQVTP